MAGSLLLALGLICFPLRSEVRLPHLIGDGMVLQRNADVRIWGWARPGEKVRVDFMNVSYQADASAKGEWEIHLKNLRAGGPFDMVIRAANTITLHEIRVGDVWVCSGQSNMVLPMSRVSPLYENEIATSENPDIRLFSVPEGYNFNLEMTDVPYGAWKEANPQNILNFSAVSYFFARELYGTYHVPIGLITASLGGSPAEAWISEDALKKFPACYQEMQKFKDTALIKQIEYSDWQKSKAFYNTLAKLDEGYHNPEGPWYKPGIQTTSWQTMKVPGYWADTPLGPVNGVVWFRRTFNVPSEMAGKRVNLLMGRIVDADSVFVNGMFVGTTSYQYPPRRYQIPEGVLTTGENTIVVRVISNAGKGGFVPDKPYEIVSGDKTIDLKGDWYFRLGAKMEPAPGQTFIRWKPGGLYNAMIHPLLNYTIKGVIWYQGESNADRAKEYHDLFATLINDWRANWHEGNFPFLFVQLPNYMEAKNVPTESDWALLREAQLQALSLPNTAMAVAIDLGEWNDIHPLRKQEVGQRLALAAMKVAYGDKKVVYSGPIFQSMEINHDRVILRFTHTGSGLVAKGGKALNRFQVAGEDRHFVWAEAKIEGNKVVIWSSQVKKPVAVRYAWADNPEGANLYNKEGLPASPFRTDNW